MEVIVFSVSVNHVNGSLLDFTFLIPYGLYLLLCFLLKEFINSLYYKSIKSEVSISKKRFTTIKHFVYDTLIDLPNSKFVLMIDEETKIITPAVYTKRNGRVSMINRNADFDVYEQIEINNGSFSKDYTFIRSYKIRDKKTGELIPQEISDGSRIYYIEQGWENPSVQNMVIKKDGTFNNSLMFSGNYKIILNRGNFVAQDTIDMKIHPGDNFKVFEVVPYLRIIEPEIQLKDRVVTAKFKLEQVTSNKVYRVSLFAYSHIDVSSKLNLVNKTIELNRAIADGEEFQLSINLDEYSSTLLSGKSYYFRIGAQSQGSETKYNYATAVKLNL